MKIKELFQKNIYRNINCVINVEDSDSKTVCEELDEYVVTEDMEKNFHDFFSSYIKSLYYKTDKTGVWISGLSGSGKSHFLKVIASFLDGKKINNKSPLTFFYDKFKDAMVLSDIKIINSRGTADIILFNINSQALSRFRKEGLIKVFMKVFYDALGYCGDIPYIAEFERELDMKGYYSSFKEAYKEITGHNWTENRKNSYSDRDNVIIALKQSAGLSKKEAVKLFGKTDDYSAEKFARTVADYCNSIGEHRIIFLLDNIDKYKGNKKTFLSDLQTTIEQIGKMLRGKAWIAVTSRVPLDSMAKDMALSKIKKNFSCQLRISIDNTGAIIKKRILEKSLLAKDYLSLYYKKKKDYLSSSGMFGSVEEFTGVYPFLPIQFNLISKLLEKILRTGDFEGKISMLKIFQETTEMIDEKNTGFIVPFYSFYESLAYALPPGVNKIITHACNNRNLTGEDCELLKILFMIKYIKDVRPTVENLSTLSIVHIDQDKRALRNAVEKSLERLTGESFVKKEGKEYELLVDEEVFYYKTSLEIEPSVTGTVKNLMIKSFGAGPLPDDEKDLYNKTKEIFHIYLEELKNYIPYYSSKDGTLYPGKQIIERGIELLSKIAGAEDETFLDDLLLYKEDLEKLSDDITSVRNFFKSQVKVFNIARKGYSDFLTDRDYLPEEIKEKIDEMKKILHMEEPYMRIKDLPVLSDKIKKAHDIILREMKCHVLEKIDAISVIINEELNRYKDILTPAFTGNILSYYRNMEKEINKINDCTRIVALTVQLEQQKYLSFQQIDEEIKKIHGHTWKKDIEYVDMRKIVLWNHVIENKHDLNLYLNHLRGNLEKILNEDKKIRFV
ncbi:MAG: BREX system P-loop protein BrxC [Candidatus Eremiobacterota bacterium]